MSLIDILLITFGCLLFVTFITIIILKTRKVTAEGQTYSKKYEKTYYIIGIILLIFLIIMIVFAFLKGFKPLIHKSKVLISKTIKNRL